ncbi:proton-conducting transporter membrane subunit [Mycoplasmatota bacterium WC44]
MLSLELVVLGTLSLGILSYLVSKVSKQLGSILTILTSLAVFGGIGYFGFFETLDFSVNYMPEIVGFEYSHLGLFFTVLVTFIFSMVSFFNPFFIKDFKYPAIYNMLYLFSLAGIVGVFFASNFVSLFVFFEIVVWTSMFLIPLGGKRKPAVTYFIFSTVGSFSMLYAILFMGNVTGTYEINAALSALTGTNALIVYILLGVTAFAKLGAYPFFIWLPKVLGNSPDPVSAVFSGGIEKLGAFIAVLGIIKIAPASIMFEPVGLMVQNYLLALLGGVTVIAGTLYAIRQDDAKKLLAYSSAANGGYILLALAIGSSISISGALYHIVAHSLASAAAFLAIGVVTYKTKTSKISELGGMIHHMPITYMVYLMAIISMAGIPPMGGFISKWLIFQALIQQDMIFVAVAAFIGSIGSFLYVFRPLAALFLGQKLPKYKAVKEANIFMLLPMLTLIGLSFYLGVFTNELLGFINNILGELGYSALTLGTYTITGTNGVLDPVMIALMFGIGVAIIAVIFLILPKSRKVGLMDTYTAGEFIYTEELLHYSADFYAPIERLYPEQPRINKIYSLIKAKVTEFGSFIKYWFFTNKPEVTVFWIVAILAILLWGDIV